MGPLDRIRLMTLKRGSASAFAFVLTMGVVNLFADATYEGGASINCTPQTTVATFVYSVGAGSTDGATFATSNGGLTWSPVPVGTGSHNAGLGRPIGLTVDGEALFTDVCTGCAQGDALAASQCDHVFAMKCGF